jgi:hypothetical protein
MTSQAQGHGHGHDVHPHVWGASAWLVYHAAALSAPATLAAVDAERLQRFYENFGYGLPCGVCRQHYAAGLKDHPPVGFRTNLEAFEWTVMVHNAVNRAAKPWPKPQWTTQQALEHWTQELGTAFVPSRARPHSYMPLLALGCVAALVIGLQYRCRRQR